jgi:hypothetical protein
MVLKVEDLEIYQMANEIIEILPKRLNAYIGSIKRAHADDMKT